MNNNNNNEKNNNFGVKSLALGALTILPITIGLGLGIKDGLNIIKSNKVNLNPVVGERPNRLEMIGRSVGKDTNALISSATNQAKQNVLKGISNINSNSFALMLEKDGPQRRAVIAAYRNMLNSPYLALSKDEILAEESSLMSSLNNDSKSFSSDFIDRIKKRSMEFGIDKQSEFHEEFSSEIKRQLKLESVIEKSGVATNAPVISDMQTLITTRVDKSKIINYKGTSQEHLQVKNRLAELEKFIHESTTNGKYGNVSVYKVTDKTLGGHSYIARIETNNTFLDMPLSASRGHIDPKYKAQGGIVYQYTGRSRSPQYKSAIAVGSTIIDKQGTIETIEDTAFNRFKILYKDITSATGLKKTRLLEQYNKIYDEGQRISSGFNEQQRANLILETFKLKINIPNFDIMNPKHWSELLASNKFKAHDMSNTHLAIGTLFQKEAPTTETLIGNGDELSVKSKTSSFRKVNTILSSNSGIDKKLEWHTGSMLGFEAQNDLGEAILSMQSPNRRSNVVLYQFEQKQLDELSKIAKNAGLDSEVDKIKSWKNFMFKYDLYDGSYLGSTINYQTSTSSFRKIRLNDPLSSGKDSAFLSWLRTTAGNTDKDIFVTKEILKKYGYQIGRTEGGSIASFKQDSETLGYVIKRNSIKEDNGLLSFSYETQRAAGNYTKAKGFGIKGHIIKTKDEVLLEEIARTTGKSLAQVKVEFAHMKGSVAVGTANQILREKAAMRMSMLTSAQLFLSKETSLTKSDILNWGKTLNVSKKNTEEIALEVAKKMSSSGVSTENIANVLRGHYLESSQQTRSNIEKAIGRSDFIKSLVSGRGFIGLDTFSIDTASELQGAGKTASIERRTLHSILQNLNSIGIKDKDATRIISDIMRRTGSNKLSQLITSNALITSSLSFSGKNDIEPLKNIVNKINGNFSFGEKNISDINNSFLMSEDWFRENHLIKLKLNTPKSRMATLGIGKTDEILIPGLRGIPGLEKLMSKEGGVAYNLGSKYTEHLQEFIRLSNDPNAKQEDISKAFGDLKKYTDISASESVLTGYTGKVAGSSFGRMMSMNKVTFSNKQYNEMMRRAKADKFQSIFQSDRVFFSAIHSQKQFNKSLGEQEALLGEEAIKERIKIFMKGDKPIYGIFGRHPSLGEGHGQATMIRRARLSSSNQALSQNKEIQELVRNTLKKEGKIYGKDVGQFLSVASDSQMSKLADILYKNTSRLKNMGEATIFAPLMEGVYQVDGKDVNYQWSRMHRAYADTDGDNAYSILSFNKETNSIYRHSLKNNTMASSFFLANAEFDAIQNFIKNHQATKSIITSQTTASDTLVDDIMKMIFSKRVEKLSTALDALKVATLTTGESAKLNAQSMQLLTIMEEMMLKSKKAKSSMNIADQFAQAVFQQNKEQFSNIIKEHILGTDGKLDVSVNLDQFNGLNGLDGTVSSHLDFNEQLDYIWNNYTKVRAQGGMELRSIRTIANQLNRTELEGLTPEVNQRITRMMNTLSEGKGSLIHGMLAEESGIIAKPDLIKDVIKPSAYNLNKIKELISNKKIALPIAIGIGAVALTSMLMTPGYNPKELPNPEEPVVKKQYISNNILQGFSDTLSGEPNNYQNNNLEVNPQNIIDNETYIESSGQSGRFESTINNIRNLESVKKIVSASGFSRNHIYIQDNRRPITKNYIDSIREN